MLSGRVHCSPKIADRDSGLGLGVALRAQSAGEGLDLLDEGVVHVLVDEDAGACAAALAHVDEEADVACDSGLLQVGILADDHCRLAAQLQSALLQVGLAGHAHDLVAPVCEDGAHQPPCIRNSTELRMRSFQTGREEVSAHIEKKSRGVETHTAEEPVKAIFLMSMWRQISSPVGSL